MASFEKIKLSGANNKNGIIQVAGGWLGVNTLIHATTVSQNVIDEVWLWAMAEDNTLDAQSFRVFDTSTSFRYFQTNFVAGNEPKLILPGVAVSGDGTSSTSLSAVFGSGSANYVNVWGYVNRITP